MTAFEGEENAREALRQLLICHPKIPADSLMQKELKDAGLGVVIDELLDASVERATQREPVLVFPDDDKVRDGDGEGERERPSACLRR